MSLLTEGLVLRTTVCAEADLIVSLYTRERGKLHVLAKHALKSFRRFPGQLELFNHLEVSLRASRRPDLPLLESSRLLEDFPRLRPHLGKVAAAGMLAEVAEIASGEFDPDPPVFAILLQAFRRLDREARPEPILWASLLRLLDRLGYRPALTNCARCQQPLPERGLYFSAAAGGALCAACGRQAPPAAHFSRSTLRTFQQALRLPLSRLPRLGFTRSVAQDSAALLPAYAEYQLAHPLKSSQFLRALSRISSTPRR